MDKIHATYMFVWLSFSLAKSTEHPNSASKNLLAIVFRGWEEKT